MLQNVNNLKVYSEVLVDSALEQQGIIAPTPKKKKEPKKILITAQFHGLDPKKAEAVANSDETKEAQATRNTSDLKAAADR